MKSWRTGKEWHLIKVKELTENPVDTLMNLTDMELKVIVANEVQIFFKLHFNLLLLHRCFFTVQ